MTEVQLFRYTATPVHERDYTRPLPPTYRRFGFISEVTLKQLSPSLKKSLKMLIFNPGRVEQATLLRRGTRTTTLPTPRTPPTLQTTRPSRCSHKVVLWWWWWWWWWWWRRSCWWFPPQIGVNLHPPSQALQSRTAGDNHHRHHPDYHDDDDHHPHHGDFYNHYRDQHHHHRDYDNHKIIIISVLIVIIIIFKHHCRHHDYQNQQHLKLYFRQNSFSYDANPRINSRTFRKQKSPLRNRSPSLSPSRFDHIVFSFPGHLLWW